jgi:hypothetical protein
MYGLKAVLFREAGFIHSGYDGLRLAAARQAVPFREASSSVAFEAAVAH